MDPTNPLASNTWTAVGPAADRRHLTGTVGSVAGRVGGHRRRPVRPLGQHRLRRRRQRRHLEDDQLPDDRPGGADLHPADRLRPDLRHEHRQHRRLRPQQRPEPVDHLRRHRRGGHRHRRASASSARWTAGRPGRCSTAPTTPCRSRLRDHRLATTFVGTTSFKVVVDPQPTATGEVIVYAALSGGRNGGLWRSLDTGQTWQLMRAGQADRRRLRPGQRHRRRHRPTRPATSRSSTPASGRRRLHQPNRGQIWTSCSAGSVGDPLIQDGDVAAASPGAGRRPRTAPPTAPRAGSSWPSRP